MIEIEPGDSFVVTVLFGGQLSIVDLTAFGPMLEEKLAGREHIRIVFDWTGIDQWEVGTSDAAVWPHWRAVAQPVERVAIIHERRWNRQAALLAAMLRVNKIETRSWLPSAFSDTLLWLRA